MKGVGIVPCEVKAYCRHSQSEIYTTQYETNERLSFWLSDSHPWCDFEHAYLRTSWVRLIKAICRHHSCFVAHDPTICWQGCTLAATWSGRIETELWRLAHRAAVAKFIGGGCRVVSMLASLTPAYADLSGNDQAILCSKGDIDRVTRFPVDDQSSKLGYTILHSSRVAKQSVRHAVGCLR